MHSNVYNLNIVVRFCRILVYKTFCNPLFIHTSLGVHRIELNVNERKIPVIFVLN